MAARSAGWSVACAMALFASVGQVQADPPPPAGSTPPAAPGIATQPSTAPTIDRHGPVVLAGITVEDGDTAWRLDGILPVPLAAAPRLRIGLIGGYAHSAAAIPGLLSVDVYGANVTAAAFYDWRLPIVSSAGDLVVSIEGGPSFTRLWLDLAEPPMPASHDTLNVFGLHLAGAFQFRARGGFVGSAQLVGVNIPFNNPKPSDPRWNISTQAKYELAFLAGYQFR